MAVKVLMLIFMAGVCSAQMSRFGSRSFSSFHGGVGSRRTLPSQGSGFGSQRTVQLSGSRSNPPRTSLTQSGTDSSAGFRRRFVSIQRPVATQQRSQVTSTRTQSLQPDAVDFGQQTAPVAPAFQQPVVHQPAVAKPAPQPVAAAPQPAPVQPAISAAPASGTVHLSRAASAVPGAVPGGFMGMNPMAAMSPMMNPMMSPMMNPMMNPMGMMSPMGMGPGGMGMMGGFPMSYDTMEDIYFDPDRPDPVRVVPPVAGMGPVPAAMPVPAAAPARPAATSGAHATSGIDQSVIASALQTALSRVGQGQTITG